MDKLKKYRITFIKKEIIEVEAYNMDAAEDLAIDILDNDKYAWSFEPPEEIITEEIK